MSSNAPEISSHRIDEIEVLRALAIIITLVHHMFSFLFVWRLEARDQAYALMTYWGGVDVFFAVSGFVIARDFFARQQRASPQTSFWKISAAFWIRRAFRLLPSAWLWLGLFLLATVYLNQSSAFGSFERSLGDTIAAVFQFANYHQYQCAEKTATCGVNGVYWSLSLEEQFYLLLPLLIFVSRKFLPSVLVAAFGIQFFVDRPEWSLGWAFRTDSILLGVLLAVWSQKDSYARWAPRFLAEKAFLRGLCVLCLVVAVLVIPSPRNQIPWAVGWLSLASAMLVWIASYGKNYLMGPGYLRQSLVWLGSRSYAIYLTHMFAFRLILELLYRDLPPWQMLTSDSTLTVMALALPLTLILSEFNYRLVEQPLRLIGRKWAASIEREQKAQDLPRSA